MFGREGRMLVRQRRMLVSQRRMLVSQRRMLVSQRRMLVSQRRMFERQRRYRYPHAGSLKTRNRTSTSLDTPQFLRWSGQTGGPLE